MPVRRGHVAPQNTYLDTIIRKFEVQHRKFLITNVRMKDCAIIFCNDGFCEMFGYSRVEIMQKPGTCDFLTGPATPESAMAQLAQALLGSEEMKVELLYYRKDGSSLPCLVDVVPVKNEEGAVAMFIMNFEELKDTAFKSGRGNANHRLSQDWFSSSRGKSFKLRLPSLRTMTLSQQSLAKEGIDPAIDDQSDGDSLAMKDFQGPLNENCIQPEAGEWEALIELGNKSDVQTVRDSIGHPPPSQEEVRLDPDLRYTNTKLTHAQSQDSFHSIRRASSVDNIELMRSKFEKKFREKRISSGNDGVKTLAILLLARENNLRISAPNHYPETLTKMYKCVVIGLDSSLHDFFSFPHSPLQFTQLGEDKSNVITNLITANY
ncbi:hypothetical protein scyTo_0004679 [Scyliorhinus torazame]|uniref:PAS domain-containing protein n=1 Tax=Scyliorhinus torazame TaxID=75743 RepID=A0A401NVF3_SCYTO|nr:hypothetical protein [Scyliorhinus torazame]